MSRPIPSAPPVLLAPSNFQNHGINIPNVQDPMQRMTVMDLTNAILSVLQSQAPRTQPTGAPLATHSVLDSVRELKRRRIEFSNQADENVEQFLKKFESMMDFFRLHETDVISALADILEGAELRFFQHSQSGVQHLGFCEEKLWGSFWMSRVANSTPR